MQIFYLGTGILLLSIPLILLRARATRIMLEKQLEAEIQEKQHIISLVSHDIKSPFSRIFALEQLINMDGHKLSDQQKGYLDMIHQVVADGLGLIRNLVDYRNLEYRKIEIIPEYIDLKKLIGNCVTGMSSLAEKKSISFGYDTMEDVRLVSDTLLVTRIIENILSNAIKFSPPGRKITLSLIQEKSRALIKIKDQGPGFTPDDLEKLFQKFQRLSARPTAGESATGLGLFITKSMLERLGGKIRCVATKNLGSTFIVELPLTH